MLTTPNRGSRTFNLSISERWSQRIQRSKNVWRIFAAGDVTLLSMSDTDLELLARYTRHRAEEAFAEIVNRAGYASPIRTPRGRDIMAACGQLKSQSEKLRASAVRAGALPP